MLKSLKSSILSLLSILLLSGCVNQNVENKKELKIAATSIAVTEVLSAMHVPAAQVVGIPSSETYSVPNEYKKATSLGTAMSPDMEKLANINPTLILSPNSLEGELAPKYKKLNITSSFLNLKSVAGMYKSIEELGVMLDRKEEAGKLVNEFVDYMNTYKKTHQGKSSTKVLILMGLPGSYVVATESSYVGDLVKLAGGDNVYGNGDGQDFVNVNPEDMLQKKPELILRTSHAMPEQVAKMFAKEFEDNDIWSKFNAVKKKKVYDLDYNNFGMSANMNYKKALTELEEILYGKD